MQDKYINTHGEIITYYENSVDFQKSSNSDSVSNDDLIVESLNYIVNILNWCFFTLCILWGSVLYIAFMQKR